MRDFVRPVAAVLGIAGLAVAISGASGSDAFAQAKQQQMAPPQKQAPAQAAPPPQAAQPAVQNKGNIDLVVKYYDKLSEALGDDQQ